jgi:DNA sulfur modification protein DndD
MREETVNRRITNAIDEIPLDSLRKYLKDRLRFERSKMDRDQPYFKQDYRDATTKFAPGHPDELAEYDVESLTESAVSESIAGPVSESTSDPVQIFEIRLKNWRQYGGEQSVQLHSTDGKLINIIEGQNGAGKSNLLNAITLCFYGKEVQEQADNEDLEQLPFATQSRIDAKETGETVSGYIEVILGVSEAEYLFRREFETTKRGVDEFEDTLEDLELRRKIDNEWRRADGPSTYLNQVLPARVSDYFLFDGEDLDGVFNEAYPSRVEDAILDVSHLELINRAVDHFAKVRSDIEREASDVEGEAADIRAELADVEDELEARKDERAGVSDEIEATQENINKIDAKLKDVSDEYVNRRYKEREELSEEVDNFEERRDDLQEEMKQLMVELGPTLYGADALLDAYDAMSEMSDAEDIPPKIQRRFINEIIERGECICGRPIEEDSTEHDHLRELRQSVFDVSEEQLDDSTRIPTMFESTHDNMERLIEKRQEAVRIEDQISDAKTEIQNITNELKAHELPDDVDVATLESNREELEGDLEDLREDRAHLKVEIEELEDKKEELQEELQAELDKQEEHQDLRAQLALVNLAEGCLKTIKEDILAELRDRTEANVDTYFNQLIWKEESFDVRLGDDYSISVIDEYGDNKIGSLSAGETQVLALSFMAALTDISGFNAPVVIDTPLGRISSRPKSLIAQNLPRYMEDTQITFLMTDEEYTAEVQSMMADAVEHEYRLVYDSSETTIVRRDSAQEVNL